MFIYILGQNTARHNIIYSSNEILSDFSTFYIIKNNIMYSSSSYVYHFLL